MWAQREMSSAKADYSSPCREVRYLTYVNTALYFYAPVYLYANAMTHVWQVMLRCTKDNFHSRVWLLHMGQKICHLV